MSATFLPNEPSRESLEAELARLSPFLYDIALPHGLRTFGPGTAPRRDLEASRLADLLACVLDPVEREIGLEGQSLLEVACNCGGLSIEAARRGAEVLGTDPVAHYIEQAQFLKRALAVENVAFRRAGIEDSADFGQFDVTLCCGLLYHLENPVRSMRALAEATRRAMVVDTQVVPGATGAIWQMNVVPAVTRNARSASTSLWREQAACQFRPSLDAVVELLRFLGFDRVETLPIAENSPQASRRNGAVRTVIGYRDGGE